ncbi:MAG: Holliday junction resolvase RuvX [Bacteroidota bacterium]|nr:Holliday junction resolvase RuvX [Bacteroidota bacterium]
MARIMAIDYGRKRVGIAVTDENQIIASALTTVHAREIFEFLDDYLREEEVECIVVGEPKDWQGRDSEAVEFINPFVKKLHKKYSGVRIERHDESYTSKMAFQAMIDAGLKKKARQQKETIDKISATLILQSFMEANPKN